MRETFQSPSNNGGDLHNFVSKSISEIPSSLLDSPLMRRGGFDVFSGIADEYIRTSLLAEAIERREFATESLVAGADAEEIRGGLPRRKFLSGTGGEFRADFITPTG